MIHGFYRSLRCDNSLENFGLFLNGEPSGIWWRSLTGGGYFFGKLNTKLQFDDIENGFIYPDLETLLVGAFENDVMVKASERSLENISVSDYGILVPRYSEPKPNAFQFYLEKTQYDVINELFDSDICKEPTIPDPYESKLLEVKTSLIEDAGQGLFARQNVKQGKVVAYFNGIRTSSENYTKSSDYSISTSQPVSLSKMPNSSNESYKVLENKSSENVIMFDIPEEYRSTEKYCATLAHKICHSFQPNAIYHYAFHPRFGFIRSAIASRDIKECEEITCDYKYSIHKNPPEWYLKCLKKHLMEVLNLKEEEIKSKFNQLHPNLITVLDC